MASLATGWILLMSWTGATSVLAAFEGSGRTTRADPEASSTSVQKGEQSLPNDANGDNVSGTP